MKIESTLTPGLREAVRLNYEAANYTDAIRDATFYLRDLIRERVDLDLDGVKLAHQAFGGDSPKLKINKLETVSEKDAQEGLHLMVWGLFLGIRNPRSHDKHSDTKADADAVILFVDYLARQIGAASPSFALDEYVQRVFDDKFAVTERYATLLVNEIPPKKRFDVFYAVYRGMHDQGQNNAIRLFFRILLPLLTPSEREQAYKLVSAELATADESRMIQNLSVLPPTDWGSVAELSRLRVEAAAVASVRRGDNTTGKGGVLGTWATGLFPSFSLKNELVRAVCDRLNTEKPGPCGYIYDYLLGPLPSLIDAPTPLLVVALAKRLVAGDRGAFDTVTRWAGRNGLEAWTKPFEQAMAEFQESPGYDDGVPF